MKVNSRNTEIVDKIDKLSNLKFFSPKSLSCGNVGGLCGKKIN
jgi:hypothetical protein